MSEKEQARAETHPEGRRRFRRARRVVVGVAAVLLLALIAVSYAPLRTLSSLEKVDDFPLYVMHYRGTYLFDLFAERGIEWGPFQKVYKAVNPEACTSVAALDSDGGAVFGRNLDWQHRASLLLYTDPPHGYASVSMVDLYYLGFEGWQHIPWSKRFALLAAPYAAIDGMNECGVAIAQNGVPARNTPKDLNRPTLLNSQIIRLVLDHARDVNEAVALIQKYNVEFVGPSSVHFHVADASGGSAVVEYVNGGISVVRGDKRWQVSTNFLFSEPVKPDCWRYNKASETLDTTDGTISQAGAMDLLEAVKLDNTVWSIVYGLSTGQITLALGRDYNRIHAFSLDMANQGRQ
jgi:hypothetical protein